MAGLIDSWTAIYSNHPALRTLIEFAHLGGLLAGGGLAVAADRSLLRLLGAGSSQAQREAGVRGIEGTHRLVIAGLTLVIMSGLLLMLADLDTFLTSKVFWLKMGLMVLLLANGLIVTLQERRALSGDSRAWPRLRLAAGASLSLWFLVTLFGAALPNIG